MGLKLPQEVNAKQEVETLEALTGFETKNQYSVQDNKGNPIGYAAEQPGSALTTIARLFYSQGRPLEIDITDKNGNIELILSKGFHFLLPHYEIKDSKGNVIVKAKTRFNLLKKKIDILDTNENVLFTAKAAAFHIKKLGFKILRNGEEKATITKQWSGMGKEVFTEADNFHIQYNSVKDNEWRKIFLAFAFAIDITFFER